MGYAKNLTYLSWQAPGISIFSSLRMKALYHGSESSAPVTNHFTVIEMPRMKVQDMYILYMYLYLLHVDLYVYTCFYFFLHCYKNSTIFQVIIRFEVVSHLHLNFDVFPRALVEKNNIPFFSPFATASSTNELPTKEMQLFGKSSSSQIIGFFVILDTLVWIGGQVFFCSPVQGLLYKAIFG